MLGAALEAGKDLYIDIMSLTFKENSYNILHVSDFHLCNESQEIN